MDFEKLKNPETLAEGILEVQEYISGLEKKMDDLSKSRDSLMDSNQKLFMRITSGVNVEEEKPRTKEDIRKSFVSHFIKEDA